MKYLTAILLIVYSNFSFALTTIQKDADGSIAMESLETSEALLNEPTETNLRLWITLDIEMQLDFSQLTDKEALRQKLKVAKDVGKFLKPLIKNKLVEERGDNFGHTVFVEVGYEGLQELLNNPMVILIVDSKP